MTPCIFDGTGFPIHPASHIYEVMLGEHITARYLQLIVQVFTPIDFLGMRAGVFGCQTTDLNRNKSKNDNRKKSTNKAKINRGKRVREKVGTGAYGRPSTHVRSEIEVLPVGNVSILSVAKVLLKAPKRAQ